MSFKNVICHSCEDSFPEDETIKVKVWTGAIEAVLSTKYRCLGCHADIRKSSATLNPDSSKDREGEEWKTDYNPFDNSEDEWKHEDE